MLFIIFSYIRLRGRNCNFMDSIYGSLNGKIRSIDNNEKFNYTFKDYYIKSAYNCCSGGNYKNDFVDLCIMKDLLKQGVRCLDFEIFSIDDQPVIATSTSDSFYIKETFNSVNFADVMKTINSYAFSGGSCPNPTDPIIIHLRVKSNHQQTYSKMATIFKAYNSVMLGKDYSFESEGINLGTLPLLQFQKKIILIVEKNSNNNNAFLENKEFM